MSDYGGRWWLATLTQETLERLRAAKLDPPADNGGERRDMRGRRFKKQVKDAPRTAISD